MLTAMFYLEKRVEKLSAPDFILTGKKLNCRRIYFGSRLSWRIHTYIVETNVLKTSK